MTYIFLGYQFHHRKQVRLADWIGGNPHKKKLTNQRLVEYKSANPKVVKGQIVSEKPDPMACSSPWHVGSGTRKGLWFRGANGALNFFWAPKTQHTNVTLPSESFVFLFQYIQYLIRFKEWYLSSSGFFVAKLILPYPSTWNRYRKPTIYAFHLLTPKTKNNKLRYFNIQK